MNLTTEPEFKAEDETTDCQTCGREFVPANPQQVECSRRDCCGARGAAKRNYRDDRRKAAAGKRGITF